jgi:hypothetical protein
MTYTKWQNKLHVNIHFVVPVSLHETLPTFMLGALRLLRASNCNAECFYLFSFKTEVSGGFVIRY